jgi:hypothetical protein
MMILSELFLAADRGSASCGVVDFDSSSAMIAIPEELDGENNSPRCQPASDEAFTPCLLRRRADHCRINTASMIKLRIGVVRIQINPVRFPPRVAL